MRKFFALAISGAFLISLAGCQQESKSPVIARVGKAVLTLDDLYESIPPEYRDHITREQNISYVKQWIDNELFYQEALRRRIDKEPVIQKRSAKMKRDLLCAEIISRNAGSNAAAQISEGMIQDYYEKNKNSFVRERDAAKFIEIVIPEQSLAAQVKGQARPDNFSELAAKYSQAPAQDPRFIGFMDIEGLPSQIAGMLSQLSPGTISSPIKTEAGYHIIHLLDKQKAGTIMPLDEVREEIANRLTSQLQKSALDQALSELRSKMNVEYNFELIPNTLR
jgi:hypothetical protein